jgi:hypothetical protein
LSAVVTLNKFSGNWRMSLYAGLILLVGLGVTIGAAVTGAPNPRILYLICLAALCANPVLYLDGLNGKFAMLGCFMAAYFVFYGVGDLGAALSCQLLGDPQAGPLGAAEAVILVGALMAIVGYRWAVGAVGRRAHRTAPKDWSRAAVLVVGTGLFAVGTVAVWYLNVFVMPDKNVYASHRLAQINPYLTAALLLGGLVMPLGAMILSYAYAAYRRAYMYPLVLAVVIMQAITGFVTDEKAIVMKGGLIVILTKVLIDGKLPKLWLAGAAAFVVFGFPILQGYRSEVIGVQGMNHIQVAEHLGRALELAIAASGKVMQAKGDERAQTFFERASMKASVELPVNKIGVDADYQYGSTLAPVLMAFIPRILVPDKFSADSGREFGRDFRASNYTDTYISPSHLGELYWNFGWLGVVLGMLAIGFLLGYIGANCDFSEYRSVTRLLMFASTVYLLVWGFEASIAVNYVVWLRGLAVICAFHYVLARVPAERGCGSTGGVARLPASVGAVPERSFSNLLS